MISIVGAILLIGVAVVLFVTIQHRRQRIVTPSALANRILRAPERILIDMPRTLASLPVEEQPGFLRQTESELARAGELRIRRTFVNCWADVIEAPSGASFKVFHMFLFRTAPQEFRDTLAWDGRCWTAVEFLRLVGRLAEGQESGNLSKRPKTPSHDQLEKMHDFAMRKTKGADKEVIRQWSALLRALVSILPTRKVSKSRKKRNRHSGKPQLQGNANREQRLPNALNAANKTPALASFQMIAREVFLEYRSRVATLEPGNHTLTKSEGGRS